MNQDGTKEIAEATKEGFDLLKRLGSFISGPPAQVLGKWEDDLKFWRWKNLLRIHKKKEEILREAGMVENYRVIPPKIALPLIEAASLEESETLSDMWAQLIANFENGSSDVELTPAFVEILAKISPLEAKILKAIYNLPMKAVMHNGIVSSRLPNEAVIDLKEPTHENWKKDGLKPEIKMALVNLVRLGCLDPIRSIAGNEVYSKVMPTELGNLFIKACEKSKSKDISDS